MGAKAFLNLTPLESKNQDPGIRWERLDNVVGEGRVAEKENVRRKEIAGLWGHPSQSHLQV